MKSSHTKLAARLARVAACVLLASTATTLGACRTSAPESPADDVEAEIAALSDWLERHPEDDDARRRLAQLHWLFKADGASARPHLEALAKGGDALARAELTWMAYARFDEAGVWTHATALIEAATRAKAAQRGPELDTLTALSARLLDEVYGQHEGDAARFSAWFDALDATRVPAEAYDVLATRRARIARNAGQDDAPFFARQGCLTDWAVGPIEGHLGELDLARVPVDAPLEVGGIDPVLVDCGVRLWNPQPHPGIRRLRTEVTVEEGPLVLRSSGGEASRLYVDGVPVYLGDRVDRWPAQRPEIRVSVTPGKHSLELRTLVSDEQVWVSLRARDGRGRPLVGKASVAAPTQAGPSAWSQAGPFDRIDEGAKTPSAFAEPVYAPLREMLALDDALADADSDRAEAAAQRLEAYEGRPPEAHLLLADFENMDPSRARTSSAARERKHLERALEADPKAWRAQLRWTQQLLGRGDAADAVEQLDRLADEGLAGFELELLRFAAFRSRSNELMGDAALERALADAPAQCDVLNQAREVAEERREVEAVDRLTAAMAHCSGTLGLRGALASRRGRHDEAKQAYATRIQRAPDDLSAHRQLAEIAVTQRQWEQAQTHLEAVLHWAPWRATTRIALADLMAERGMVEAAREMVTAALEKTPHLYRLWEVAEHLGIDDPVRDWRVEGSDYIRNYDASDPIYEGAAQVLVLDRDVAWVYPDGSQRHLIHQITELRSKASLDAHGELAVPGGAQILTLRTIKPDGRIIEPESVAGKEGVSLRELELGDLFEIEYVLGGPPDPRMPGYVDLSRFRFASFDTPYHHSELVVVHPKGMPVQVESRNRPPKVERGSWKGRQTLRFLAKNMARHRPEPQMRNAIDELPMVRVFTPVDLDDWLSGLATEVRTAQRSNPQLRDHVARLVEGTSNQREALERLSRWTLDKVEDTAAVAYPATVTFADRKGSALMLLRVMLNEAGIRNELWLTRDRFGPADRPEGHPLLSAYDSPMLAVWPDGTKEPVMVMTSAKTIPLGYLTPGYATGPALALPLREGETGGARTLPDTPSHLRESRRYELALQLDASGRGVVEGSLELTGLEALLWRNELSRIDEARRGEAFQAAEIPRIFGYTTLDLDALHIEGIDDLQAPLRFEFRAAGPGIAMAQGQELLLPLAAVQLNLAAKAATLPERETGMVIPFAPETSFHLVVRAPQLSWGQLPPQARETGEWGSFERSVGTRDGALVVDARAQLRVGVVEAQAYPQLAEFAAQVAAREQALLSLRPAQ